MAVQSNDRQCPMLLALHKENLKNYRLSLQLPEFKESFKYLPDPFLFVGLKCSSSGTPSAPGPLQPAQQTGPGHGQTHHLPQTVQVTQIIFLDYPEGFYIC